VNFFAPLKHVTIFFCIFIQVEDGKLQFR
jgi:hypothetical protein